MRKIALITGVNGQDGAYLAKFLLKKKYTVIGTYRRVNPNLNGLKKLDIEKKIILKRLDLNNSSQIKYIFNNYKIHEVYNLASQSHVNDSFNNPTKTLSINAKSVLEILEIIRKKNYRIKFYQASSSEMFGNSKSKKQSEKTKFNPISPYGASKLFAHYLTKIYRESFKIYAVSGILFNHESPLRNEKYVTSKIIRGLINIKNNKVKKIQIGNINIKRDWGYSKDYVGQMWRMMQLNKPSDFVIATGKSNSLKQFINIAAKEIGINTKWRGKGINLKLINKKDNKVIMSIDKKLYRPSDIISTRGDISKARKYLKWKPKTNFSQLIRILINDQIKEIK